MRSSDLHHRPSRHASPVLEAARAARSGHGAAPARRADRNWPEADAAFVADEYGNLIHVRHIAVQKQEVLPIVAFGEMLDTDQAILAIYAGAIDCIDLEPPLAQFLAELELALRRRSPEFETRLKAMRSASELAELDRGKRRILGLFAAGKGQQQNIARARHDRQPSSSVEIDEIKAAAPAAQHQGLGADDDRLFSLIAANTRLGENFGSSSFPKRAPFRPRPSDQPGRCSFLLGSHLPIRHCPRARWWWRITSSMMKRRNFSLNSRIEIGFVGQAAQPRDLLLLALRIGRRHRRPRLVGARPPW